MRKFSNENNLPPKALLLLDNCSAHGPIEGLCSEDGNIVSMLLPPNVTAVIQPMDQNPIKIVKLHYRNKMISSIVAQEDASIHDLLQKHTLRNAICLLSAAWEDVSPAIIQKAWSKILNWDDGDYDDEDNMPLSDLVPTIDTYSDMLQQTQELLSKLATDSTISIEAIEEWNKDDVNEIDADSSDEDGDSNENCQHQEATVSYGEAISAVNTLLKWAEKNEDRANKHIPNLLNLRSDIVMSNFTKPRKQTTLDSYFVQGA